MARIAPGRVQSGPFFPGMAIRLARFVQSHIQKQGRTVPVQRLMLKSKIHRATLTEVNLEYEGSITIDRRLMEAADLLPGEQVHVLNINNGERLITYVIEGPPDSGVVALNGAAARLGAKGDPVIILSYWVVDDGTSRGITPRIVHVDQQNRIIPENPQQ
ncbi:aspartate 1-decarboxylase [Thermogutta terrifontis]|nr:aspartate 1-decarboxylase [Thermogutta terrifontis]